MVNWALHVALDTLLEIMLTVSLRRNAKHDYQDG
jgi:hypothetical protein